MRAAVLWDGGRFTVEGLAYNDYDQAQVILAAHPDRVAAVLGGECGLDDVGPAIARLATDPRVGKILVAPGMMAS